MKKSKAISLLLCLSLLASLLIPGTLAMPAKAAEGGTDNGMKVNKTAVANDNGTYTITLEAYATGEKIISEVKKDVPTDIVLVLDQSGSMAENMYTYDFREYSGMSNDDFYYVRYNQDRADSRNLYYQQADRSYATVSVTLTPGVKYSPYESGTTNSSYYYNYYNSNNLYAKVGADYKKVTVSIETEWNGITPKSFYVYKIEDVGTVRSEGWNSPPTFSGVDGNVLYSATTDESQNVYTYTYTDKNGETKTIGTSTGIDTKPTDFMLYKRYQTGRTTKLQALKNAVTTFANNVAEKAKGVDGKYGTDDDIQHRIAIVGFGSDNATDPSYTNTELFIGSTQYKYNSSEISKKYGEAFQRMDLPDGRNNITYSISSLAASGGTAIDLGTNMANKVLEAYKSDTDRAKVVIVFTDGVPGIWENETNSVRTRYANTAISNTHTSKNTYNATVYTVGVFGGADARNPGALTSSTDWDDNAVANKFMHLMSSNYLNATSMTNAGPLNPKLNGDSYYLSAGDSSALNSIFKQISDQIESGGSSTTLGSKTVIKDIVAPAFDMPENTSGIKVYTAKSNDSTTNWHDRVPFTGSVTLDTKNSAISVSGFSFKDNWCGTETKDGNVTFHNGEKLIIEFTVTPKADFLGGNNVYTNTSAAVYENANAAEPVVTFPRPQVNVPIKEVTVTAADKNVYLLGSLTAEQIKSGATVKCGDVELDLSANNYGLENWQTEYVDIAVEIKDEDGKLLTDLTDLKDDTTYTVSATVAPKYTASLVSSGAAAVAKSDTEAGNVNVFKPELTFADSEVYYGDTTPTTYSNLTNTKWMHGTTEADTTKMGSAPELTLTYTPDSTKIADGKVNTKQDIAVDATVKIDGTDVTGNTTFRHTNCNDKTCTVPDDKEFLLHVKTCQLTITKKGGADGEPYVFTVNKGKAKYSEVTIVGNGSVTIYELPVGIYTIEEDTGWSWRYNPTYADSSASLTANSPTGAITCTNTKAKNYWLNGYSDVVPNTYESKN